MSSSNRTTSRGGKGAKGDKTHKNDKSDTGKGSGDKQQTGAGGDNVRSKSDDPSIKEKVRQIMEMTQRSEEEVCLALHECDNDVERAADMLFENQGQGEWETSVKKKKNRQASSSKAENTTETPTEEWNEQAVPEKEKPRNKSGGPPRIHGRHNDSRGWRGREKQENERNLEDGGRQDHRERRGRSGGPIRGGGGRGRGGGRAGGRYPPRSSRNTFNNNRPMETWDNSNTWDPNTTINHNESNWDEGPGIDEWTTEEYTGSLADTKVFTPSVQPEILKEPEIISRSPIPEERTQLPLQQNQMLSQSPVPLVGTLNAAQTQYLNQLTQQNSDMKASHLSSQAYGNTSAQGSQVYSNTQYMPPNTYVSSGYTPVNTNYGSIPEAQTTSQPVRTKTQRARVPPPSKIPASAVEMPGDLSSIGYLDVQFGAMDLISDTSSFDGVTETKFSSTNNSVLDSSSTPSSNLDLNTGGQNVSLDAYAAQQQKANTQSSISSALSQSLSNSESIPQTSEHLTAGYTAPPRSSMTGSGTQSATPSAVDMSKQSDSHSYSQSANYNSYHPKSSSYQTQNYSSASYNSAQTTSSFVANQASNSYVNSNTGSYNTPNVTNAYQNAYSSTSSYQSSANAGGYPATANSYPSNNQAYPQNTSQSVYGANSGLNNSSNYSNATSGTPQYNSYNSSANHKLVKDSTYDNSTTAVSSTPSSTTSVSTATSALSLTQTTATGTKAATTLAKNSSSVVSNIPPGVAAPVISTPYIMGQGIPYFQPPIYSYEDVQLLQQRIPHMTTPFYEMSYQAPTTLPGVRDGALATYSMSDGRFTRGDNNASPVPSTLSQQTSTLTQGHQAQPMLAQTAGPYFFAAPYNPMQSYQFGAVYSQLPAATNAHGSSNSTQYPKPGTYGSGYGSGYDALSQTQDYKGAYGNAQGQNKSTGANASSTGSTGNDLSAMYGKSHTAIGKVSSYDKQGFHSGTPPPFSGALHGSQNAGLAPSGTGYGPQVYIPTMAPHQQHHSTQLMHQPLHQDSGNTSGQRSQASNQAKTGAKQYPNSYWNQA